jgi:D-alanyl-D-alanine dipeptidase
MRGVRPAFLKLSLFAIFCMPRAVRAAAPESPPVATSVHQLLLVKAANWNSSSAVLERYERREGNAWHLVGSSVHVSLGRHGLAWGRGLHPTGESGPMKHEGDGRSPAGVYRLETAFGADPSLPEGARGFPYLQASASSYCVEEVHSPHYNELVDTSLVKLPKWQRLSPLRRPDGLFHFGVVVTQNAPDKIAGRGSCVFLHIWRGEHVPTSGCTAMAPEAIEAILRWLDPKAEPVLVQLPEPVYRAVAARWALPDENAPDDVAP